jgi:predicted TIM-barrel fold metal-dependent hydrolase
MRILDTHHHIWDLSQNSYPWLTHGKEPKPYGDYSAIQKNYLIEDYLRDVDQSKVVRSVHLGAGVDYFGEAAWLQSLSDDTSRSRGFPHAFVTKADFLHPNFEWHIEELLKHANMRGVRQIPSGAVTAGHPDLMNSPLWERGVEIIGRKGLLLDIQAHPVQLERVASIAKKNPGTLFIIDHCGMINYKNSELLEVWRRGVRALALCPNVRMKISAFMIYDLAFTSESIKPFVHEMIDAFGVARCFFGSNYPVDSLSCSFSELWKKYQESIAEFTLDEQDMLLYRNGATTYRVV